MAVSLQKGGNVNLSKQAPGLTSITLGLGWDARVTDGAPFDLDASAFLLKADDKVRADSDFIFYGNKKTEDSTVTHSGDSIKGEAEGDDESITIDLTKLSIDIQKIAFTVTIHDAEERKQNFGQVSKAYIRVINNADNAEIARFDLSEDASTETAMVFGELYRHEADWKFKAIGQGYAGGLKALATQYGVNAG